MRLRLKHLSNAISRVGAPSGRLRQRHDAKIILTFAVPDVDDAIAQLKAKGVAIFSSPWQHPEEEGLTGGFITACIRDPEGNLIELEQILS